MNDSQKITNSLTIAMDGQHFCTFTTNEEDWDSARWAYAFVCAMRAAGFAKESIDEIFKFENADAVETHFIMAGE